MLSNRAREEFMKKARHYFNEDDYNCAETICRTIFGDYYNKPVDLRNVTALSGGKSGGVCGAIIVGEMGISRKYGRTNPEQNNSVANCALQKFHDKIIDKYGSLYCIKLKAFQENKSINSNADEKLCTSLMEDVVRVALYIIDGFEPANFKI